MQLEFHEIANIFPMMSEKEYKDLKNNIDINGLMVPIVLYEGKILDGRNRYKACQELGVTFKFEEFSQNISPYKFIWSLNAERRHLFEAQKTAIHFIVKQKDEQWQKEQEQKKQDANKARSEATKRQPRTEDGKKLTSKAGPVSYDTTPDNRTRTQIADEIGVSSATVGRVMALGNERPDLLKDLAMGKTTLTKAQRQAKKDKLADKTPPVPEGIYRIIYADPPWKYNDSGLDEYGHAERHYPSLTISELCAFEIPKTEDNAVLFLWVTSPMLEESFKVIKAWGFEYKTSFVWDKVKHNFGHYNSVRHEFLLIATKGSCVPDESKLFDSVQTIERSEKHSEKPEEFRKIIDALYIYGKRIELFARGEVKEGWDLWGNQIIQDIIKKN